MADKKEIYQTAQTILGRAENAFENGYGTKAQRMYINSYELMMRAEQEDQAEKVAETFKTNFGKTIFDVKLG